MHKLGNVQCLSHLCGKRDLPIQIREMTEHHRGKDGTKWPCTCRTTNIIHPFVLSFLDVLDLMFGLVLVLVVMLRSVINAAQTWNIFGVSM